MNPLAEVVVDFLLVVVLFVMVGGASHRAGGTCEQRHLDYSAQAASSPKPAP